jgi:hypothetical protein
MSRRVQILRECSTTDGRGPRLGIDDDLAQLPQVDDEAAVADAMTCDAVASSADGDRQIGLARKPESCDDIIDVERSHDQLRMPLDHPVEGGSRDVEVAVIGRDDRPSMPFSQLRRRRHRPTLRHLDQLPAELGKRRTPGEPKRQIEVGDEVLDHLSHT